MELKLGADLNEIELT